MVSVLNGPKNKMRNTCGHISIHLPGVYPTGCAEYRNRDAEVVECVIREESVATVPVADWLADVERRKADKETACKNTHDERMRAQRLVEYQKLQKKEFVNA